MKCLVVEPSGVLWEKEAPKIDLEVLTALVGGYIEALPLPLADHVMYVNEDGRLARLPPNPVASALACLSGMSISVGLLLAEQALFGTMVIAGPLDENGEHTDVVPELKAQIVDCVSQFTREEY